MRYRSSLFLIVAGLAGLGAAGAGDIFCNNQGRDCSDRWSPGATLIRTSAAPQPQSAVPPPSSNFATPTARGQEEKAVPSSRPEELELIMPLVEGTK